MLGRHVNIKEIENMNVNEYVEIEIERSQIEKSEQKSQLCEECKSEGVTYTLFKSQLCWECFVEWRA